MSEALRERLQATLENSYLIERELGRGGMATVYLARDVKHQRLVALKVLHPDLAAALGAERFLAEIRTTANLQHPHILPLHDSGSVPSHPERSEGPAFLYYVMPFVQGESLRARLERETQLPIDDAIRITTEVLGALDYAHRHGVVHRDIKPENILLHDGSAMVADFGIALAVQQASGQRMTQTGLSLGTPQYMAPEQAMGEKTVDARADVYAVGAVLYEMLVGEPPFTGPTVQAIIARTMTERPTAPSTRRDTVPPAVDAAVTRALAKLPADRFANAAQFADALSAERTGYVRPPSVDRRPRSARQRLRFAAGMAMALAAGVALGALGMRLARHETTAPVAHFEFAAPDSVSVMEIGTAVSLSPDDKMVAFVGLAQDNTRIYVRRLDELQVRPVAGTEGAIVPMYSPDGRWIAFYANDGKFRKVEANGGVPVTIGASAAQTGFDWLGDDALVVGADPSRHGLIRIGGDGGPGVLITHPDSAHGVVDHFWPAVDATHKLILLTLYDGVSTAGSRIGVTSLAGGRVDDIGVHGIAPLGIIDDQLIYVRADGAIMAVPFNASQRRVTGSAVPVLDPVPFCATCNGDARVRLSRRGSLVALRGSSLTRWLVVDARGSSRALDERWYPFSGLPQFSPDGKRVAIPIASDGEQRTQDIWVYDIATGAKTRVTNVRQGLADAPHWTPDGKQIVFAVRLPGEVGTAFIQSASGVSAPVRIASDSIHAFAADVSPDLRHAVLSRLENRSESLDTLTIGTNHIGMFAGARDGAAFVQPHFSPDGRWIAYASTESGRPAVYVRPFPGPGIPVQISDSNADNPRWLDGNRLEYHEGLREVAATLATSPSLHVVSKATLFANFKQGPSRLAADVSPAGDRLLVGETNAANTRVEVILNWAQALRERLRQ